MNSGGSPTRSIRTLPSGLSADFPAPRRSWSPSSGSTKRRSGTFSRQARQRAARRWSMPGYVLAGEPLDERGDLGADRWPARPVEVGLLLSDQAVVPPPLLSPIAGLVV